MKQKNQTILKTLILSFLFITTLTLTGCDNGDTQLPNPPTINDGGDNDDDIGNGDDGEVENPNPPTIIGTTTITSTKGQVINVKQTDKGFIFEGYENKIVLLEVYGDTCPHCVDAIPSYNSIQSSYPDDVVVIGLESWGTLHYAPQQQYITIPRQNTGNMFAFIQSLTGYARQAVPYLMILDRSGAITYDKILANFPMNEIETRIQQLL